LRSLHLPFLWPYSQNWAQTAFLLVYLNHTQLSLHTAGSTSEQPFAESATYTTQDTGIHTKCTLVQALRLCTGRTAHRRRGRALLRLCTGRTSHRRRGIALLRLCTGRTAHRRSRGIALLRLYTGRTAHRGSRGIALLRLCTGRTAHRGSRGIALFFHDHSTR
jgi:hypothetical protein